MNLALFDLDYTLLPIDSDQAWVEYMIDAGRHADPRARSKLDEIMAQHEAGTLQDADYHNFMLGTLAAHHPARLRHWHEEYMREVIASAIRPAALELVASHRDAGELCCIVTGTNTFVTRPIGAALGVAHLLGTVPQLLGSGEQARFTGAYEGVPCVGAGKIVHVDAWLAARGQQWSDFASTTFYSDSTYDLPLLGRVDVPVATNPGPRLEAHAREHGWRILRIFP